MIVTVPASSANLGPGFDALGMALSLTCEVGFVDEGVPDGAVELDAHHPAVIAAARLGGRKRLWLRHHIPIGRGLGFSGAVRVAGLVAALVEREGPDVDPHAHAAEVMTIATDLEGHPDNVAASFFGGVVASVGTRTVRVPLGFDPAVVAWVPRLETSTDESRRALPDTVPFDDAVFNVGRTALLVAALAAGDVAALRDATADRLHQDRRLAVAVRSHLALSIGLDAGAWCGWLSGSGPTIALLCSPEAADDLAAALPSDGAAKVLRIDRHGAAVRPR